ncbi:MAG: tyrosine-protein kinase, partial [Proteobacteria bacterium]|nr:tyrosine-protein kinase [Pseudomonadota bacterium]
MENKTNQQNTYIQDPVYEEENEIGKLVGLLVDGRWIILTVTLVFFLIGYYRAMFAIPIYQANALVQVSNDSNSVVTGLTDMGSVFSLPSSIESEKVVVSSRMVMEQVANELGLEIGVAPVYFPDIGKGLVRILGEDGTHWLASLYPKYAWGGEVINVSRLEIDGDQDRKLMLVAGEGGNYRILSGEQMILTGKVGELARNKGVSVLVTDLKSRPGVQFELWKIPLLSVAQQLQGSLTVEEVGEWSSVLELTYKGEEPAKIRKILNSITQHYLMQNVQLMSAEAEKRLKFLETKLPEIKASLEATENLLNAYRLKNDSVDLTLETRAILEQIVNLDAQLNELTFKEAELSRRFTKSHPNYVALLSKQKTLLKQRAELSEQVHKLPVTQQEILRLTRDMEVNQAIYIQLLNTVQELKVVKAGTVGNVRILDRAEVLGGPISPRRGRMILISTLLGFILAVGLVWLRGILHRGIKSPDDIEGIGIPVYASIPNSAAQKTIEQLVQGSEKTGPNESMLLAVHAKDDPAIEAIRSLRTSMHFAMLETEKNILVITGPGQDVGKSFVSANLAVVYAQSGNKVLLIDADMRKGYMQMMF